MTAFDNIKTNNWPATSNDFEDFLVLELPLNGQAALTSSRRDIIAGGKVLFPKRTLTNTGTASLEAGIVYSTEGTQTGSDWGAGHEITGAFRKGALLYTASGEGAFAAGNSSLRYTFPSPITVNNNVKIYFWRNGGNIKVNAGETDEQTDSTSSGYTTWTIPASDVGVLRNVELYTAVNTGPYWSGIEVDGVQLYDAPGGSKKHYDNNASFDSNAYLQLAAADSAFDLGTDDFCIEYYFKADNLSSAYKLFQLGTEINWTENIEMKMNTNGTINYEIYPGGSVAQSNYGFTGTQTFTAGTWNHVAFTRQGSTFRGFLNGVADGSATYAGSISSPTSAHHRPTFGARTNGSVTTIQGPRLVGSIQDFRLYKGTAKYTSNFTPPGAILG